MVVASFDIARVLHVSPATVIRELKKTKLESIKSAAVADNTTRTCGVEIRLVEEEAYVGIEESELDEMWSYVGKKANQRWLWHAIDRLTG